MNQSVYSKTVGDQRAAQEAKPYLCHPNMRARSGPQRVAPVMRKAAVAGDKKVDVQVKEKAYIRLLSRQGDITTETFDRDTPSAEK